MVLGATESLLQGIHHRQRAPARMGCDPVPLSALASPTSGAQRLGDSYLATSLSFVLLTAFLDLFIVTFERAVVLQETLELLQNILESFMVLLIFLGQGSEMVSQGIYIRIPQHVDRVVGKAYACPTERQSSAKTVDIQSKSEEV